MFIRTENVLESVTVEKGQLGVELQVSLAEGQGVRLAAGRPQ